MGLNYGVFLLLQATKCVRASTDNGECRALTLGRLKVPFSEGQKIYSAQKYGLPLEAFHGYAEHLLKAMGCSSVESLDYSDFEGADHLWNLNTSLSGSERGTGLVHRYNLILDFGTTEHIFVAPQSIATAGAMLKVGGRLNLMLPVCGSLDHGMYQFCPSWFYSMDSEWLELERLYFYVNQNKSHRLKLWDGLAEQFKQHIDGTFDGSYLANLLQYANAPIYSFAIFRKRKELDEKRFMQDTHQLIYARHWAEKGVEKETGGTGNNGMRVLAERCLPEVMKAVVYKMMINSALVGPEEIWPLP